MDSDDTNVVLARLDGGLDGGEVVVADQVDFRVHKWELAVNGHSEIIGATPDLAVWILGVERTEFAFPLFVDFDKNDDLRVGFYDELSDGGVVGVSAIDIETEETDGVGGRWGAGEWGPWPQGGAQENGAGAYGRCNEFLAERAESDRADDEADDELKPEMIGEIEEPMDGAEFAQKAHDDSS